MLPLPTSTRFAETGLASSSGRLFRVQAFREYEHRVARCRHTRWHCGGRSRLRNRQNACSFNLSRARAGRVHGSNSAAGIGLGHVQVQVVGCERTVLLGEVPHRARMRFSVTSRRPGGVGQPPARLRGTMENASTGQMRSSNPPPGCGAGCAGVRRSRLGVWSHGKVHSAQPVGFRMRFSVRPPAQSAFFREGPHAECAFP